MAETVRIEIPIETVDNTDPELSNVTRNLERLGEAATNANTRVQRASNTVSQFDRQSERTQRSLAQWAKEKYQVLLEAKDKISPIVQTLGNSLRSFGSKTWRVTMKAFDLVTSPVRGIINLLKNPIFQVGAVLGVSIGLSDTVETYKDFEAAMSQVQAISGATANDLNKLTDKAKEMGATTKFTAEESAQAFNYMAMAGWKTEDMLSGIEGILNLAAASGEDLGTTSDIVTDALTAFGMKASESAHFADVMAVASSNANTTVSGMGETFKYAAAMAGTLGYSIEDVALATGLMANNGIKGTMAGTALNSIFTRLSTNTSGATDALKELGIEFFDSNGNARDLSDVLDELRLATAGYTDEQKSALANTIAGMEAQKGLLSILNASEEDYNKLAEAVNNADGAAQAMSDTMLDNLQGSITLLQSAVDGVKISFGERLAPYVRGIADYLTEQMPAIEAGLDDFMDFVDRKIDKLQDKFEEITATEEWQNADFLGKVKIAWDELIAEPFSEWWNSTGKAMLSETAGDIGNAIGSGISSSILMLLGIDVPGSVNEGASVGRAFAEGFSEGFDFELISSKLWDGFKNLLSSAGKLLPGGEQADLGSVVSAALLAKLAVPAVSFGRGIFGTGKALFGPSGTGGASLMSTMLGSAGMGTGLLGFGANTAINLGAGNLAGGASLSAGALSALGLGATAGGVIGGASLISGGIDIYKAIKSSDKEESAAYGESGAWKVGGVAAGAAAGAALGSVIPGLGTAVGALIGAGVGGIAGWIKGNKVKEEYQENVEEMQKEAEKARKVFEVTGLSIDEVRFKNEALTEAMHDAEVSAEEFAVMFQEECARVAKEAFGDIKLSLEEVKKVASEVTFADMADELTEFVDASGKTEQSLASLRTAVVNLKRENWKISLGMELSEADMDSYKKAIETFVASAQTYIDDNHYEATVALRLLIGEDADTTTLDAYYESMKTQVESLSQQLNDTIEIAFSDSIITLDEAAELESLQNQITEITNKLTQAKTEAQFQALQIKYNGAALDLSSFTALQEELKANVATAEEQYDEALTVTLTNLNLQLAEGTITQEEYDELAQKATEGYYANINEINTRVQSFNLESISTAWADELDGILPELEGTTAEKLEEAMNRALIIKPDVSAWTNEEIIDWFGLGDIDTASATMIASELLTTALAVPEGTKETILQNFKDSIPTAEEIQAGIDWSSFTYYDKDDIFGQVFQYWVSPDSNFSKSNTMFDSTSEYFDQQTLQLSQEIHDHLERNLDPEAVSAFMEQYMTQATGEMDFTEVMKAYGPISNEYYEQLQQEWRAAGLGMGGALNGGASESLLGYSPLLRSDLQSALDMATVSPFSVTAKINVTPSYNFGGGSSLLTQSQFSAFPMLSNAAGGYVSGGPQLSWLAEEGYGEFVIPTNPSRRARALELYAQAGQVLGVGAHAEGGIVGRISPYSGFVDDNINFLNEAFTNESGAFNETTDTNYPTSTPQKSSTTEGSTKIEVSVQMTPEFNIQGGEGQSEEDIMNVIRRHMKEMADELGGEIAGKLEAVFANMPLQEA